MGLEMYLSQENLADRQGKVYLFVALDMSRSG